MPTVRYTGGQLGMSPHLSNDKRFHIQIIRFLLAATASIDKVLTKMGNNNLGPVADGIEHPANLAPGYDTDTHI